MTERARRRRTGAAHSARAAHPGTRLCDRAAQLLLGRRRPRNGRRRRGGHWSSASARCPRSRLRWGRGSCSRDRVTLRRSALERARPSTQRVEHAVTRPGGACHQTESLTGGSSLRKPDRRVLGRSGTISPASRPRPPGVGRVDADGKRHSTIRADAVKTGRGRSTTKRPPQPRRGVESRRIRLVPHVTRQHDYGQRTGRSGISHHYPSHPAGWTTHDNPAVLRRENLPAARSNHRVQRANRPRETTDRQTSATATSIDARRTATTSPKSKPCQPTSSLRRGSTGVWPPRLRRLGARQICRSGTLSDP